MIVINYNGGNSNIIDAVKQTNALLGDKKFLRAIASHTDNFAGSNANGQTLSDLIAGSDLQMDIVYYRTFFPSRAYAYDDPSNPTLIHLNKRHLNRSIASFCNTLIHETIHAIDAADGNHYFGHGDNSSFGKEDTAPYWIGCLAERTVSGSNDVCDYPDNSDADTVDLASIEAPSPNEATA